MLKNKKQNVSYVKRFCSTFEEQIVSYCFFLIISYILWLTIYILHSVVSFSAHEMSLSAGLQYERSLFYSTFATEDRREGMEAFIGKKTPSFSGK